MSGFISRRTRVHACAVVVAAAVLLTSCAKDTDEAAAEPSASTSTTAAPSASAAPTPSATPSNTPSAEPTTAPEPAAPTTVTTPNGLHSFTLPAGWTAVEAEPLPILGHDIGYVTPAAFTVMDGTGNPVARFHSGVSLDGAGMHSPGHVLYDAQELPGYTNKQGQPVHFQFESRPDRINGGRGYHIELESGGLPDAGGMDVGPNNGRFLMSDGGVLFEAIIEPGAFADDAAATAWMETDLYRQLKEMLLSLTYNG